ncbi:darobactin export ABC transporter permease subunit [Vibrio sp. 1F279]|uniref:darobactin export ABC transporter permease subunit n=1 Tax=unclassified Vibrio TaxID=2614977 RepID=UPI00352C0D70
MLKTFTSPKTLSSITGMFSISLGTVLLGVMLVFMWSDHDINSQISETVFKIETQFNLPNGDHVKSSKAPAALLSKLREHPQVKSVGRVKSELVTISYGTEEVKSADVLAMDESARKMLKLDNDGEFAMSSNGVYLSEPFAKKLTRSPRSLIGKRLKLNGLGLYQVEGIIKLDKRSSIRPDMIIAFSPTYDSVIKSQYDNWYDTHVDVFVDLKNKTPLNLNQIILENAPQIPGAPFTPESFIQLSQRPISQLHYDLNFSDALGLTFSKSSLYLIYGVCGFSFLLGFVGFVSSMISIQLSQVERIRTMLSIGGSYYQIILNALMERRIALLGGVVLSISIFNAGLFFLTEAFTFLSVLSTEVQWVMSVVMLICFVVVYVTVIALVVSQAIALQEGQSISRFSDLNMVHLTKFIMMIQIVITTMVIFISVSVTYELLSVKQVDYGYDIKRTHYAKLNGRNDSKARYLRDRIAEQGQVSEVTSWYPFDRSVSYASVSTAQQTMDEKIIPAKYFYAGPKIVDILGLTVLTQNHAVPVLREKDTSKRVFVIVTEAFSHLFANISAEKLIEHTFYTNLGDGVKEIQVVDVVSNFYLGKVKPSFEPIMIIIDETKANYLIVNDDATKVVLNDTTFISSLDARDEEYSDLSTIVIYLLFVIVLNIVLLLLNTMTNSLVEVERNRFSLIIMRQLGAGLKSIFWYVFKNNILIYLGASGVGVLLGYAAISRKILALDGVQFGLSHYVMSLLVVAATTAFIISLSLVISRKQFLADLKE